MPEAFRGRGPEKPRDRERSARHFRADLERFAFLTPNPAALLLRVGSPEPCSSQPPGTVPIESEEGLALRVLCQAPTFPSVPTAGVTGGLTCEGVHDGEPTCSQEAAR
jgi:hypothetical protein